MVINSSSNVYKYNKALYGGAVHISCAAPAFFEYDTFSNNEASEGSAVENMGMDTITFTNCNFADNSGQLGIVFFNQG